MKIAAQNTSANSANNPVNSAANSAADSGTTAAVQAEMVAVLFRQFKPIVFGNLAVSLIFAWMTWGRVDHGLLAGWLLAVFLLTFVRIAVVLRYLRRPPPPAQALRWAWLATAFSGLSGLLWGAISLLFLLPDQLVTIVLVGFVLAGMTGGSVASLSAFPPAYYAFAVLAVVPFIARTFMIGGELFQVLGLLAICLLGVNLYYSHVIWRTIRSSVMLRFENLELIRQLQQEKERAESASQAKSRFLAAASHDLRQPIHALGLFAGSLSLLGQQPQPDREALASVASRIQASLRSLGILLSGLLDISRLESGTVEVRVRPVALAEVFDEVEHGFAVMARDKGLQLRVVRTRLWVHADPVLLKRALGNLVENALRYTVRGGLVVGCRRRGASIALQVWDSGIGIDTQQIPHIFREFYQVEDVVRSQEQGLGLGLSIVKRAADLMGAGVEVKSRPGRGSVFSMLLPRAEAMPAVMPAAAQAAHDTPVSLGILLIDDQQAVLEATAELLRGWGHRVLTARTVSEALAMAAREDERIELILADFRLDRQVTGADAIRQVNARLPHPVPAIIITGDTSPERIQEAMSSGHRILHKPIAAEVLMATIAEVCAEESTASRRRQSRLQTAVG